MFSLKSTIVGSAAALLIGGASAQPIPLPDVFVQLSDNDAESLINGPASINPLTLDIGDRLRGQFDIQTLEGLINGITVNGPLFNGNELTGIFDIQVLTKIVTVDPTSPTGFRYTFTFGSSGNLSTANAMVEMYYDPSGNYTRIGCATTAICEATAKDGTLWAAFGQTSAQNFWTASAVTDNIALIGAITPPASGGSYNAALNFIVNNTGYQYVNQDCDVFNPTLGLAQVCASGSLLGTGGVNTPYQSFSNVDFTVRTAVPEPATLALLAAGLIAAGGMRRRKS